MLPRNDSCNQRCFQSRPFSSQDGCAVSRMLFSECQHSIQGLRPDGDTGKNLAGLFPKVMRKQEIGGVRLAALVRFAHLMSPHGVNGWVALPVVGQAQE